MVWLLWTPWMGKLTSRIVTEQDHEKHEGYEKLRF